MGRKNDDASLVLVIIAFVIILLGAGLWKFSNAMCVDFSIGAKFIGFAVLALVLIWLAVEFGDFVFKQVTPLALSVVAFGFTSVLRHWATFGCRSNFLDRDEPIFNVEWYGQNPFLIVVVLAPLALYFFRWFRERY